MCHFGQVRLTESDRKAVRGLWGVIIPVYASIGLCVLAALAFHAGSRDGRMMAQASNPASAPAADR
jgi:hypothetical protein